MSKCKLQKLIQSHKRIELVTGQMPHAIRTQVWTVEGLCNFLTIDLITLYPTYGGRIFHKLGLNCCIATSKCTLCEKGLPVPQPDAMPPLLRHLDFSAVFQLRLLDFDPEAHIPPIEVELKLRQHQRPNERHHFTKLKYKYVAHYARHTVLDRIKAFE